MAATHCFHCGLPNPPTALTLQVGSEVKEFCCLGCQSAAQTIIESGLGEYYKFHQPDQHPVENQLTEKTKASFLIYDRPDIQNEFVTFSDNSNLQCILLVDGISCSACTWLIEKRLLQFSGVKAASVNAGTHRLSLTLNAEETPLSSVFNALFLIGYQASPFTPEHEDLVQQKTARRYILRLGVAGIGMMQAMMNAVALYSGQISSQHESWLWWTSLFLTLPVIFVSAWPFFTAALQSLKGKQLSMDVSVSLAILSAFFASVYATLTGHGEVYYESVNMFTFFLVLSRYLEFRARTLANARGNSKTRHLPQTCELVKGEQRQHIPTRDLAAGDVILLRAGETCPVDGNVVVGRSSFDESTFTGEFQGVEKTVGDTVSAGTINQQQAVQIQITRTFAGSSFNLLQSLVERASGEKSRIAELADKGSRQFIWSTLIISLLIGLAWLWYDPSRAFWVVISVLVVTCPCALSLATPTALSQATLKLKKHGLIITRGYALERLASLTHFAFDKTGTLTEGAFTLREINLQPLANRLQLNETDVRVIAAQLEASSEHSIASAFNDIDTSQSRFQLTHVSQLASTGVEAESEQGHWFIGGAESNNQTTTGTYLDLRLNDQLIAQLALSDTIRQTVRPLFDELSKLNITSHILTGDANQLAEADFRELNLTGEYIGGCSAQDKVNWVHHKAELHLAVVGDGLNDAPLLAKAPLSVAMLNATDMTKSQADVLLLTNDLQTLALGIKVARKTQSIIKQNLFWALVYNAIALPVAALGLVNPWQAAIGMSISSLVVVGNAIRLRK